MRMESGEGDAHIRIQRSTTSTSLIASNLKVNTEVNKLFQISTSFIINNLKVNIDDNEEWQLFYALWAWRPWPCGAPMRINANQPSPAEVPAKYRPIPAKK
jgi:hypothetical protein